MFSGDTGELIELGDDTGVLLLLLGDDAGELIWELDEDTSGVDLPPVGVCIGIDGLEIVGEETSALLPIDDAGVLLL